MALLTTIFIIFMAYNCSFVKYGSGFAIQLKRNSGFHDVFVSSILPVGNILTYTATKNTAFRIMYKGTVFGYFGGEGLVFNEYWD